MLSEYQYKMEKLQNEAKKPRQAYLEIENRYHPDYRTNKTSQVRNLQGQVQHLKTVEETHKAKTPTKPPLQEVTQSVADLKTRSMMKQADFVSKSEAKLRKSCDGARQKMREIESVANAEIEKVKSRLMDQRVANRTELQQRCNNEFNQRPLGMSTVSSSGMARH